MFDHVSYRVQVNSRYVSFYDETVPCRNLCTFLIKLSETNRVVRS